MGGREFVTFIQYGYFLEVNIEIEGSQAFLSFKNYKLDNYLEMSSSYEERLSTSIGAVKDIIRKIRTILEGVAKHKNIYIPKNIKDLILKRFIYHLYVGI